MSRSFVLGLLLASVLTPSAALASGYGWETYGESTTLESEGGTASSLFVKAHRPLTKTLDVYAGAQFDRYQPEVGGLDRISPILGLRAGSGAIRGFAEFRYAEERPRTTYGKADPRVGATAGHWWESPLGASARAFSDTYAEVVAIPRIRWQPSAQAQTKAGLRFGLARSLFVDPYAELYFRESPDPALGRRASELRAGARAVFARGAFAATLGGFRRVASFRTAPAARWRALLTVGGTF